jgi:transposase
MGKPHPIELRARVVAFVEEGNSHREAARHFRVSPRFVNNMMILHRSHGSIAPPRQGHAPGGGKLIAHTSWIAARVADNGDVTLDELCVELAGRGVMVHRATIGRFLQRLGLSNKKKPGGQRTASAGDRPSP